MKTRRIGIAMNGVTGRMGTNQHLVRSILAIRAQGGIKIGDDVTIMPDPILLGRNAAKLEALAAAHGGLPYATDMAAVLGDPRYEVYFDAQTTQLRYAAVKKAIAAGKHVYCEKPTAENLRGAAELDTLARAARVKHGVVQDKLFLPGIRKLAGLIESGFFGRILSVRGEFGYWVFSGEQQPAQRPSWNYRKADGGGIILDMLAHWRYLVDNLFGKITSLCCVAATHIPKRWDEKHAPYSADAEDAAYTTFLTDRDVICQFNSSWCTRLRRDDLLTIHVDGTDASAIAGLRDCRIQPGSITPKPVWNPDIPSPIDYYGNWPLMPDNQVIENAFKAQWELFLRHVALDEPFPWDLREGAKGVQLAELAHESWHKRAWVDVPEF